jgi:cyclic beta-1,2-glucan synthetase
VKTPDPLFDAMVNRWLLYQAVACRLWAKAGFYQAGGRHRLSRPAAGRDGAGLGRAARCCARRSCCAPRASLRKATCSTGGTHPRAPACARIFGRPAVAAACLPALPAASGDTALLDERVPFIEGPPIPKAPKTYYVPPASQPAGRQRVRTRRPRDRPQPAVGVHGLPLMGSGDWNDGMNRVGTRARRIGVAGLVPVPLVADFAPLARARGEGTERAQRWDDAAPAGKPRCRARPGTASWYRRAFFRRRPGAGLARQHRGRIDLIAQAWACLSGVAPPERSSRRWPRCETAAGRPRRRADAAC